jgi:hypothetical protein
VNFITENHFYHPTFLTKVKFAKKQTPARKKTIGQSALLNRKKEEVNFLTKKYAISMEFMGEANKHMLLTVVTIVSVKGLRNSLRTEGGPHGRGRVGRSSS